jgi:hypothetical protein
MDKPMDSELPTGLSTALLEAGYPQAPQLRRRFARLNATMKIARFNATKSVHLLWQVMRLFGALSLKVWYSCIDK